MKLSQKFNPNTMQPLNAAPGGLWLSIQTAEHAAAELVGTGAGTPDVNGTITAGTFVPGTVMAQTSAGVFDRMTSQDLSANMPKLPFVAFSGTDDFSGRVVGAPLAFHGGARFDTEMYNTASSYTPGAPLISVAGVVEPKAAAGDHIQIVGFVGPRGLANGVLDVLMPQGVAGY